MSTGRTTRNVLAGLIPVVLLIGVVAMYAFDVPIEVAWPWIILAGVVLIVAYLSSVVAMRRRRQPGSEKENEK